MNTIDEGSEKHLLQDDTDFMIDIEDIQALKLSVPAESTKYTFMSMLLARVLNLEDESVILEPASYTAKKSPLPVEILPHIAVPSDLWLESDIAIKDARLKIQLLRALNKMLSRGIDALESGERIAVDERFLQVMREKISEYKLTDFEAQAPTYSANSPLEDGDHEQTDTASEANTYMKESSAESDATSLYSVSSRHGSLKSSKLGSRANSISRDLMFGKRKKSIFGHHQSPPRDEYSLSSPQSLNFSQDYQAPPGMSSFDSPNSPNSPNSPKSPQMNGMFSKSKFYNKLVKRSNSVVSISSPTNLTSSGGSPPHRNSVADLRTQADSVSARNSLLVAAAQRLDNQKQKHRFYIEVKKLSRNIQSLASYFGRGGTQANLVTLMEFVKKYMFKFVVVDICHLILAKVQMEPVRT